VCVCVGFFSRVSFFFFWLVLPWPSWRVDLVPKAGTAAPEAAAVIMRVLDNQHACFIVSSSSRQRPSLLFFFSSLPSRAHRLSLSLSCALSFARAPARASSAWETLRRVAGRGAGFCDFGESWQRGDKKKNQCKFYKELFRKIIIIST
jgi:hypothetical protein